MKITQDMAARLQQLKDASGKTYQDLADEVLMSASSIQRYVTGEVKDANPESYDRIVDALISGGASDTPSVLPPEPAPSSAPDGMAADEIAQQHYRHLIATHEAELARLQSLYNRSIRYKDRWIIALSSALLLFLIFTIIILLIDIANPDIGWFQGLFGGSAAFSDFGGDMLWIRP